MKLKIENIGMIHKADIRLDGLTIIAGENDTGKSTVGKLVFSLIKAFNRYEQDLKESKSDRIKALLWKNYFYLRKQYDFIENSELRDSFIPHVFWAELENAVNPSALIDEKITFLQKTDDSFDIAALNQIKSLYSEDESKDVVVKRALTKAFVSEFYFELTPSPQNSDVISTVSLSEGVNKIFDLSIRNNNVEDLNPYDELFFNDVTYIETPVVLQMYDLIRSASTLFEMDAGDEKANFFTPMSNPKVALHVKDLISKLEDAQYYPFGLSVFDNQLLDLLVEISDIVGGDGFSFDKKNRDFYFKKVNGASFRSTNTATGIKSFGIIQLLIQAEMLNERTLLIIDEPEIHLHPKWQVQYAKLIITLVKHNIPVLLTSHSPEIIQALKVFSEDQGIKDKVSYYLTESDGVSSNIVDVSGEINKIFVKLAEPLHNLVWS